MTKFETVKKVTVTEQIMDQIAALITTGQLRPGEQLPTERELAVQLGVTRGRVREALRALSLVGLITIKAGEGSFVAQMEEPLPSETILWMFHNEMHNLEEVYAARKLIETEVYVCAASRMNVKELDELERLAEEFAARHGQLEPEEQLALLDVMDLYVGEHCGNRIYAKLMQTIVLMRRETSLKLLGVPGSAENGATARRKVAIAMKSGQPETARQALYSFFDSSFRFYQSIGN